MGWAIAIETASTNGFDFDRVFDQFLADLHLLHASGELDQDGWIVQLHSDLSSPFAALIETESILAEVAYSLGITDSTIVRISITDSELFAASLRT
jgi:hypothetical protein